MISGKMYRFRVDEAIVRSRYLLAFLRSDDGQRAIDRMKTGGSESGLNLTHKRFLELPVPIAPLEIQDGIIARVDSLFEHSKSTREELNHIPRLVERYKQAVLTAAFKEAEPPNADHKKTLYEACDIKRAVTYGVIKLGDEVPDGVPCLRTSNVRWQRIETDSIKRISSSLSAEYRRTVLQGGEVLVNVRGTLGGVAVATAEMKGWNVSREVAVVPVDLATSDPAYIAYWIASDASQLWLRRVQKGVAYTGINLKDLRNLPVILPSIEKQQDIVRRVTDAFARVEAVMTESTRAAALLDRLDPAILTKAFRGELRAEAGASKKSVAERVSQ